MRIRWCWRCRREVPLVDEAEEFALIRRARYCAACGFGMEASEDLPRPLVVRAPEAFDFVAFPKGRL